MQTGWQKVDGSWYYLGPVGDGAMRKNQWVDDSYVNEKGVITRGNKNPKNPPTQEEIRWLSAITYLEAGNQSYYGKYPEK